MGAFRIFLFTYLPLCLAIAAPTAFALDGEVTYTEGSVTVMSNGGSQDAGPGTRVSTGDTVITGADGLAVIDLSNATQVKLRENTSVVIAAIGDNTQVNLTAGSLFTRIVGKLAGRFSVRADNTVAGVRGTEFFIAYGKSTDSRRDVWLCVNSGVVDVSIPSANQEVQVPAGKGINIVGGMTLTPPRGYRWTRGLNWNMDPSRGNVADHTNLDQAYGDLLNHDYN
jgi:hypothetical protein